MGKTNVDRFREEYGINSVKEVLKFLRKSGVNEKFLPLIDAQTIFKYMRGDRTIVLSEKNGRNIMYIAPTSVSYDACSVSFNDSSFELAEIDYSRISNDVNQDGEATVHKLVNQDGCIEQTDYILKLLLTPEDGTLVCYADVKKGAGSAIAFKVDPFTLEGLDENKEKVENMRARGALDYFMIPQFRGTNLINGRTKLFARTENFNVYEQNYQR